MFRKRRYILVIKHRIQQEEKDQCVF